MGGTTSNTNETLKKLHSHFRILDKQHQAGILQLVDRRTDEEFILRELVSNQERQTSIIEKLVHQKSHSKNPYIVKLTQYIFEKSANYCSNEYKVYLMFSRPEKSLNTDIIQRKVRGLAYSEDQILKIIQSGTQGLKYLKQIGHEHNSISSSNIYITKQGNYLISDPWMNPDHYKVSDHIYDSPQKFQQKLSVKPQHVQWFTSDLFSLGMVVLQCIELEYMDDIYQKGRGINTSLLNSKILKIKWPLIKNYVEGLLGSTQKRISTVHQVQALIVSLKHKNSAEFPTIQKRSGKIQLSRNTSLPILKPFEPNPQTIPEEQFLRNKDKQNVETRQVKVERIQTKSNKIVDSGYAPKQQLQKIQIIPQVNSPMLRTATFPSQTPIISNKSTVNIHPNIEVNSYKTTQTSLFQKIDNAPKVIQSNNKSISFYNHPSSNFKPLNMIPTVGLKNNPPSTFLSSLTSRSTHQGALTQRLPQTKLQTSHFNQQTSRVNNNHIRKPSTIIMNSHHQQKLPQHKPSLEYHYDYQKHPTITAQQLIKTESSTFRAPTQNSLIRSSNLGASTTLIKQSELINSANKPNSNSKSSPFAVEQTSYSYVQTAPVVNNIQNQLSPFSSAYVPKFNRTPDIYSQNKNSYLEQQQPDLTKGFSFAPIINISKNYSFSATNEGSSNSKNTPNYKQNQTNPQNNRIDSKPKNKQLMNDLEYQINHSLSDSKQKQRLNQKQKQDLTFSHINQITRQLKLQFENQNISTIQPEKEMVNTSEINSQYKIYINPFEQQFNKQFEIRQNILKAEESQLENVKSIISFEEKKQNKKYNSTIIQVSDSEDQSVISNTETQFVTQEYNIGSRYQGFKKYGMRNGLGVFVYKDGGYYEGNWKDNQMHGEGKLFYPSGKLAYEGQWRMDQFHGKGKVYNDLSNNQSIPASGYNYNDFNEMEDAWQYFQGNLYKDKKEGFGTIRFLNGEVFQGQFKEDKMEGQGVFTDINGKTIHGLWKDSRLVQQLA